jgi:hypothetical protein
VAGAVAGMFEVLRIAAGRLLCGSKNGEAGSTTQQQWRKYLPLFIREIYRNNYWWGEDVVREKSDEAIVNEINGNGLGKYLYGESKEKSGTVLTTKPESLGVESTATKELELAALQQKLFGILFDQLSPYNPLSSDSPLNKKQSPLQNVPGVTKEFSDAFQAKVLFFFFFFFLKKMIKLDKR